MVYPVRYYHMAQIKFNQLGAKPPTSELAENLHCLSVRPCNVVQYIGYFPKTGHYAILIINPMLRC